MGNHIYEVAQLREQVVRAARAIIKTGAISRSGHGNISLRIPNTKSMLLTSVINLEDLTVDKLPLVTFDGKVLDGQLDPVSAEIVGMHAVVYETNDEMGSVVHTHAPYVTTYAVADRPIECWYEGMARFELTDPVPVARYGPRGSAESISNISDVMNERSRAVLLQNHGILTFERDLMGAVRVLTVLEEAAELGIRASMIGQPTLIPAEMARYAQERAAEFAEQGAQHSH
ncbi:MAG: class II aldolase/adducin family protein [Anaerolineae bacterium]|jgi:L-fuculose-phosphate aldolase|nr:class II aldolase/adducin family protein [Anaerolineae bacterium]